MLSERRMTFFRSRHYMFGIIRSDDINHHLDDFNSRAFTKPVFRMKKLEYVISLFRIDISFAAYAFDVFYQSGVGFKGWNHLYRFENTLACLSVRRKAAPCGAAFHFVSCVDKPNSVWTLASRDDHLSGTDVAICLKRHFPLLGHGLAHK